MLNAVLLLLAAEAAVPAVDLYRVSRLAKDQIFAPETFFAENGDDDILTARFLGRDGIYPNYAIAVRYGACVANGSGGCDHRLDIRMLRHKGAPGPFDKAVAFLGRMARAKVRNAAGAKRFARQDKGLEWLATNTTACSGTFEAIEAVRKTTWTPPSDHHLRADEADEVDIWVHVPFYELAMGDLYERVTYRGPPYTNRPSGALDALIDKLEPCWKPGPSERPWSRDAKR